jgi:hypothetical protein
VPGRRAGARGEKAGAREEQTGYPINKDNKFTSVGQQETRPAVLQITPPQSMVFSGHIP